MGSLCILDINSLLDILFANILSHLVDRLSFYSWLFLLWKSFLVWCSPTSHPSEWLLSKKQGTSVGRNEEKTGLSCTVGGNVNWCTNSGKQYEVSSKIQNRTVIWSRNSTSRYLSKENKNINWKATYIYVYCSFYVFVLYIDIFIYIYIYPYVHCSTNYNSQDMEAI